MQNNIPRAISTHVVVSALLVMGWSSSLSAQGVEQACVTCTLPDRVYACEVLPPENGTMAQSAQLFCAGEMARAHGHQSCLVVRSSDGACEGEKVTLAYTGRVSEPNTSVAPVEQPAVKTNPDTPPKTLVEATDRAVKSTGKQIKNAGDAITSTGQKVGNVTVKTGKVIKETGESIGETVTNAAKSTWDCVVSLFQSC